MSKTDLANQSRPEYLWGLLAGIITGMVGFPLLCIGLRVFLWTTFADVDANDSAQEAQYTLLAINIALISSLLICCAVSSTVAYHFGNRRTRQTRQDEAEPVAVTVKDVNRTPPHALRLYATNFFLIYCALGLTVCVAMAFAGVG